MNNTMGRFIDELKTGEERDRLVEAPGFLADADWWDGTCGCLVGTVDRAAAGTYGMPMICAYTSTSWQGCMPHNRWPRAVNRFGMDRMARVIKLRAGAKLPAAKPFLVTA